MDLSLMATSLPKLLSAAIVTLKLLSVALFFGLIIGLIFAILRLNKNPINIAAIETAIVIRVA